VVDYRRGVAVSRSGQLVLAVFGAAVALTAGSLAGPATQEAAGSHMKAAPPRPLSRFTADRGLTHGSGIVAVSCSGSSSCFAVDRRGRILRYDGSNWSEPHALTIPAAGPGRVSLSCSTPSACVVAPTGFGEVALWDGKTWSEPAALSGAVGIEAVGCGHKGYCALIDAEGNSFALEAGAWRRTAGDWGSVEAISCVSETFCVSGGTNGISTWDGASWTLPSPHRTTSAVVGVSCPSSVFCVAIEGGGVLEMHGSRWSLPVRVEPPSRSPTSLGTALTAVSCPTRSFCAAVDSAGDLLQWRGGAWSRRRLERKHALTAVSCPDSSFCVAGDATGALFAVRPG
jgi:hypothetical protein